MDEKMINSIISKSQMKIAVSKFNEEDIKMEKRNIPKLVATFVLAITITGGLVYATGSTIYEKVWKQPETYKITQNLKEAYKNIYNLTEEEKSKCISKEEAKQIGNTYLKKIGFDNQAINEIKLSKEVGFLEYDNTVWSIDYEKIGITLYAETGEIKSVYIPTWKYNSTGITRKQARKIARDLLEKHRPEYDKGEYELISLKRNNEEDKQAYIWYADFYKKYGDLINPSEKVSIEWRPIVNGSYSINMESNPFENNEQKISKEDAIKIAIEKDKQIEKNKTIKKTKAKIRIKQMNENVYLRENFQEDYENGTLYFEKNGEDGYTLKKDATIYKTEKRVRKVWCIVVYYDMDNIGDYTYYIDSTTGEIIGGELGDDFYSEDVLREDPNNVIKK